MAGMRTATVDGLTFSEDGWTSPDGFTLWMDDLNGWGTGPGPGVRRDRTDRMWAHGEFAERAWRGGRLVTIEGDATAPDQAVATLAEQKINAILADGLPGLLAVTDTATVDMSATTGLFSEPKIGWKNDTTVTFQLQFICPDPRRYGAAVTSSTGVAAPGGALVYPLGSPNPPGVLDYGATGTPGTVVFTNAGTADTAPVFTITGDLPNGFTITHVESGRRLVYVGALTSGQFLRLSAADGSVKLDGYADRSVQLTVRQWTRVGKYARGTWLFEATGSTGALLTSEVKPAWW